MNASLVVTAIGPDRPGIVNRISDVARRFDANWSGSRMANLAGQFAGMVHFEVDAAKADELARALSALESPELRVIVARSAASRNASATRTVRLDLVGNDRPGIVRDLTAVLAQRGVSIDELETDVSEAAMSGEPLFKLGAVLTVPEGLADDDLRGALEALADELMVDLALAPGR